VHDPAAGGEPLHVASTEPGGSAERVGVVDDADAHVGDRLEPAVGVVREARYVVPVVHAPAVGAGEVLPEITVLDGYRRREGAVAGGVRVVVVGAEQERIDRRPVEAEGHLLQHDISHCASLGR
jgi:hypothetical protein